MRDPSRRPSLGKAGQSHGIQYAAYDSDHERIVKQYCIAIAGTIAVGMLQSFVGRLSLRALHMSAEILLSNRNVT
jgi:hypothetical protein